jgi:4-amino-4-deoxy-L-arabinose transferase-like glycosyltransferase
MSKLAGIFESFLPELLVLVAMAVLLGCNADLFSIDPYSELFHIASAKESMQVGHFWIPALNGQDYLIRPPLWTWLLTVVFQIFGASLSVARVPAVLSALLGLGLTGMLAKQLTGNRLAGCFAAAILGSGWGFVHLSILSTSDILTMDLYLGFLIAFMQWFNVAEKRHSTRAESDVFCLVMGVIAGLLLLLKGTLGLLIVAVIALSYLTLTQNWRLLQRLSPAPLFLPLLFIPLPWLLGASFASHNPLFIWDYLVSQPFFRLLGIGPWQGLLMDPLFYLKRLPLDLLPYLLLLPAIVLDDSLMPRIAQKAGQRRVGTAMGNSSSASIGGPWLPWALIWFGTGLVVYSLSAFQEPTALLPFYPPLAIITGMYLARVLEGEAGLGRAYRNTATVMVLVLMSAAVLLAIFVFQVLPANYVDGFWQLPGKPTIAFLDFGDHHIDLPEAFPLWKLWLIPGPFLLLLGGILLFVLQAMQRLPLTASASVGVFMTFFLFVKLLCLPVLSRPIPMLTAQAINRRVHSGDEIVLASRHSDVKRSLFYLNRRPDVPIRFLNDPNDLATYESKGRANRRGQLLGLMREKSYYQNPDYTVREHFRILSCYWAWDANRRSELLKFLLMRSPVFNRMKSGLVAFYSLPPEEDLPIETPDPIKQKPKRRR